MTKLLKISEAARELGCSVDWLRAAESGGKIPEATRDINGWRRYTPREVEQIGKLLFPGRRG